MTRDEVAIRIFSGLLARDPLPAQRFTPLAVRLEQLAGLAWQAADIFAKAREQSTKEVETLWNSHATTTTEPSTPPKLDGACTEDANDLFGVKQSKAGR